MRSDRGEESQEPAHPSGLPRFGKPDVDSAQEGRRDQENKKCDEPEKPRPRLVPLPQKTDVQEWRYERVNNATQCKAVEDRRRRRGFQGRIRDPLYPHQHEARNNKNKQQ